MSVLTIFLEKIAGTSVSERAGSGADGTMDRSIVGNKPFSIDPDGVSATPCRPHGPTEYTEVRGVRVVH